MSSTPQPLRPTQTWNAQDYAANGRFVADLAGDVLNMLAPVPGEAILDLGCGDGALTGAISSAGADVTACDADESMLAAAAARGLRVVRADMRELPFHGTFDAVFSNAALHWVTDQTAVVRGVRRALRPGGRFVAEMGGLGNIAAIRVALQAVMGVYGVDAEREAGSLYPSPAEYRAVLESNGFHVQTMLLVPRPTHIKAGMGRWLRTFRTAVLACLDEADRDAAVGACVRLLRPALCDSNGDWWADYVRLRFSAVRD